MNRDSQLDLFDPASRLSDAEYEKLEMRGLKRRQDALNAEWEAEQARNIETARDRFRHHLVEQAADRFKHNILGTVGTDDIEYYAGLGNFSSLPTAHLFERDHPELEALIKQHSGGLMIPREIRAWMLEQLERMGDEAFKIQREDRYEQEINNPRADSAYLKRLSEEAISSCSLFGGISSGLREMGPTPVSARSLMQKQPRQAPISSMDLTPSEEAGPAAMGRTLEDFLWNFEAAWLTEWKVPTWQSKLMDPKVMDWMHLKVRDMGRNVPSRTEYGFLGKKWTLDYFPFQPPKISYRELH